MIDLTSLKNAIESMDNLYKEISKEDNLSNLSSVLLLGIKAGFIQNFEFTYEMSWKHIKRWLGNNYDYTLVDGVTRRQLFRLAFENGLIDSIDKWMDFHNARNRTSHTYNIITAEEVYNTALEFLPESKKLYDILEVKND